jgi:PQQ-dependent catabolism-associated CXXCW motif protein
MRLVLSTITAIVLAFSAPGWAAGVPEPAGYRLDQYKAPVPDTLKGARIVDTKQAEALWRNKEALFFDVMPAAPKPANLPAGTIWRDKVREDVPGSIWLANVGYGDLSAEAADYFRRSLEAATKGNKAQPILFYCMTDCWMSWNAGKRAMEWGYSQVIWYPAGADGWAAAKLPLAENRPFAAEN